MDNKTIYYGGEYYYLDFTYFYDIYKLSSCLHSFVTYQDTYDIYDNDNNVAYTYKDLGNIEFKACDAIDKEAQYHISKVLEITIHIIDSDTFYIENNNVKSFYKIETSDGHPNFACLF